MVYILVLHALTLQPNKPVQDKLFSRISDNYANLLVERVDDRWKDRFLKVIGSTFTQAHNMHYNRSKIKFETHFVSFYR